jgi:hypothetical protein
MSDRRLNECLGILHRVCESRRGTTTVLECDDNSFVVDCSLPENTAMTGMGTAGATVETEARIKLNISQVHPGTDVTVIDRRYLSESNQHHTYIRVRLAEKKNEGPTEVAKYINERVDEEIQNCRVYFIDNGDYVKIGYTMNLNGRLSSLRCGSPYDVQVLLAIPGNYAKESELHKRFNHLHHRREWFKKGPDLMQFIAEEQAKQSNENQPVAELEQTFEPWYPKDMIMKEEKNKNPRPKDRRNEETSLNST